ncbi:MAG: DUF1836 domain-containing protein [Peptostreptococcaceae bacterium]|jgi:hypothetical protein|nr:DUF1836 domain-containing protein [Peptostreptococcaceae bacterium]
MMELNKLLNIISEMSLNENIDLKEIPNMDLYMEQVTSFMDDKLSHLKRNEKEKILTKTMINNYTKQGLLMPPNKKKYSKDHMILMLIVYYLKQILSLDDIKSLIEPVLNDMSTTDDDLIPLEDIYSIFSDLKKVTFENFENDITKKYNIIKEKTKNIEENDKKEKTLAELFLIVIMLSAQAHAQKRLCEKIIDEFFDLK